MPKKVEAYQCNVCNGIFLGIYEDALRHERMPFSIDFPLGLIYKDIESAYPISLLKEKIEPGKIINYSKYSHDRFVLTDKLFDCPTGDYTTSLQLQAGIRERRLKLLSEDEFRKFKELYEKGFHTLGFSITNITLEELVRTTKELEVLVNSLQ